MAGRAGALSASRTARVGAGAAACLLGASAVVVATRRGGPISTYAEASDLALGLDLLAGLAAIIAGATLAGARRPAVESVVLMAIGVAWFAPDWVGWEGGSAVARSLAMIAAPFIAPLILHLAIVPSVARPARSPARVLVAAAYVVTAIGAIGRALFRDPFRDRHCWSNCTDNVLLIRHDRDLARWFDTLGLYGAIAIGVVAAAVAGVRLARLSSVARRGQQAILVPVAVTGLALATHGAALVHDPAEHPTRSPFAILFLVRAAAVAAIAAGVIVTVGRAARSRRAVARLAADLGDAPAPGTLRDTLARTLGDDQLDVAYWLPESGRFVDAGGTTVDPRPGPRQATTAIVREHDDIAVVVHDASLVTSRDLAAEIGAAARLAVDNERLRAEVLGQIDELTASRARIVAAADTARRRIERDLHDGAQQRLLAVLAELRLAAAADAAQGGAAAAEITAVASAVGQTLADLRLLAHGIHPAILTDAGLAAALATLTDGATIPVDIDVRFTHRRPAGAEAAAYVVVAELMADATAHGATEATGVIDEADDDGIVVELGHDGATMSPDVVVRLRDRVGALGGRLDVEGTRVTARIPCAS